VVTIVAVGRRKHGDTKDIYELARKLLSNACCGERRRAGSPAALEGDRGVQHAGERDVPDVAAAALDEPRVHSRPETLTVETPLATLPS